MGVEGYVNNVGQVQIVSVNDVHDPPVSHVSSTFDNLKHCFAIFLSFFCLYYYNFVFVGLRGIIMVIVRLFVRQFTKCLLHGLSCWPISRLSNDSRVLFPPQPEEPGCAVCRQKSGGVGRREHGDRRHGEAAR